jgi:hypothetical protein
MSKQLFTEKESKLLFENPYVKSVSSKGITVRIPKILNMSLLINMTKEDSLERYLIITYLCPISNVKTVNGMGFTPKLTPYTK